jgi:ssDNA-binding Zn-finger/Zn-ribbon topoisomerase 1
MGDLADCPKCGKHEKKEVLSIFREMWQKGDSPLHRIYSSWEELEQHMEIKKEGTHAIQPCPNCGVKQRITKPLEGFFPYQNCKACKHPYYVNQDSTVRKLTEEEKREIPEAWIQIVENLSNKKCAIVFRLE